MLEKLYLQNFRNFEKKLIELSPKTTIILGPNASGKTNILESIHLLSTGKSFKARLEEEMIFFDSQIGRVKGKLVDETTLEIVLTKGEITLEDGKNQKTNKKRLLVNNLGKRLIDFSTNLKTVLFGPWDLDLVTESPHIRRRFLDSVLTQTDREYYRSLISYEKALRRRNKLLIRIREEGYPRASLMFWDQLLIKNGNYISDSRSQFIDFVNTTGSLEKKEYSLKYDSSTISESRLKQYEEEEVAAGTTLVGPHRDDFCFFLTKNSHRRALDRFGSRGEQRLGVLWLKLAELDFLEKESNTTPTLLLDDIFSELDSHNRDLALTLAQGQQTVITSTEPINLDFPGISQVNL